MKPIDPPDSSGEAMPQARVRLRRWHFPWLWMVPLAAALMTTYLVWERVRDLGPSISIHFQDGSGLIPGRTDIRYRGVAVGEVRTVEVSEDRKSIEVTARLRRSAASFARSDSLFWVVRLQGGIENLANVGTVISGPYIEVLPGTGQTQTSFVGMDQAPPGWDQVGLKLVLRTPRLGDVGSRTPIHYRGVEVGSVQDVRLAPDARNVDLHVVIQPRYAGLVRQGSRFWREPNVQMDFSLWRGFKVSVPPLKSLVLGGIAFATPEVSTGGPSGDGTVFPLHPKAEPAWLMWTPRIAIPPEPGVPDHDRQSEQTTSFQGSPNSSRTDSAASRSP
jgi:paraquat-inducible protein B